jgi:DUF971 family protein
VIYMSKSAEQPVPTGLDLQRKSRLLRIATSDGKAFDLLCEYLRRHSRAVREQTRSVPASGKEPVKSESINAGHDTGSYSWQTLSDPSVNPARN